MKKDRSKKQLLASTDNVLLSIRGMLNQILAESGSLPPDVKQALIQARDVTWMSFVESQEELNKTLKQDREE